MYSASCHPSHPPSHAIYCRISTADIMSRRQWRHIRIRLVNLLSTYYAEQAVNSTRFRPARGVVNTVLMFHIKLTFLLYFCSFALTDVKKQIKKKNLETKFCLELSPHFFSTLPDGSGNQTAKNCLSPSNDDWHARHFFKNEIPARWKRKWVDSQPWPPSTSRSRIEMVHGETKKFRAHSNLVT